MFKFIVNIRPLNDAREFPKSAAGQIIHSRLSVSHHTGLMLTLGALVRERAPPGRGL